MERENNADQSYPKNWLFKYVELGLDERFGLIIIGRQYYNPDGTIQNDADGNPRIEEDPHATLDYAIKEMRKDLKPPSAEFLNKIMY